MSSSTSLLASSDLLTSLTFSPLSSHLALSSLDHTLRILHPSSSVSASSLPPSVAVPPTNWNRAPREWKAHDGPVLCTTWASPEFGTVLASGGVDGAVKVWREDELPDSSFSSTSSSTNGASSLSAAAPRRGGERGQGGTTGQGWSLTASLTDAHGTIRSLSFAPPEFGLKLAAVSSDSHLRVWECLDPLGGMSEWSLVQDVDVASLPLGPCSASSLAGGSGVASASGLDGGSATPMGGKGDGAEKASATGSTASVDGRSSGLGGGRGGTVESDGGWAVDWLLEHWWGERLAVSAGTNGVVRLLFFPTPSSPLHTLHGPFLQFLTLLPSLSPSSLLPSTSSSSTRYPPASSSSEDLPSFSLHPPSTASFTPPVSSLAFAPPSGRSFHLLASGSRDSRARVWKLFPPVLGGHVPNPTDPAAALGEPGVVLSPEEGEWVARLDVELKAGAGGGGEEGGKAFAGGRGAGQGGMGGAGGALMGVRVGWNVTGTVLSTSGGGNEEGRVRLWKSTYTGQWRLLASLATEDAPDSPHHPHQSVQHHPASSSPLAGGGGGRGGYATNARTIASLIASNFSGHTRKSMVSIAYFVGGCVGNSASYAFGSSYAAGGSFTAPSSSTSNGRFSFMLGSVGRSRSSSNANPTATKDPFATSGGSSTTLIYLPSSSAAREKISPSSSAGLTRPGRSGSGSSALSREPSFAGSPSKGELPKPRSGSATSAGLRERAGQMSWGSDVRDDIGSGGNGGGGGMMGGIKSRIRSSSSTAAPSPPRSTSSFGSSGGRPVDAFDPSALSSKPKSRLRSSTVPSKHSSKSPFDDETSTISSFSPHDAPPPSSSRTDDASRPNLNRALSKPWDSEDESYFSLPAPACLFSSNHHSSSSWRPREREEQGAEESGSAWRTQCARRAAPST
ncbi:hypothetical protein JCM8547_004113 [Rhodosporidiobolus lusitaniae]